MTTASYDNFTYRTDDPTFLWYITNGLAEPNTRELGVVKRYLSQYPTKNHLCIDVGGHIGTTSLPYSRLFQNVLAFEPNKKNYDYFIENIRINNNRNIEVRNKGLYNKNTSCVVIPHDGGNSGCFYVKEDLQNPEAIPVSRLDDELANNSMPVDFIKIDTEGSELYVLWGAYETIKRWKPLIQIETNGQALRNYGYNDIINQHFLEGFGYRIFDSDGHNPFFYCP